MKELAENSRVSSLYLVGNLSGCSTEFSISLLEYTLLSVLAAVQIISTGGVSYISAPLVLIVTIPMELGNRMIPDSVQKENLLRKRELGTPSSIE